MVLGFTITISCIKRLTKDVSLRGWRKDLGVATVTGTFSFKRNFIPFDDKMLAKTLGSDLTTVEKNFTWLTASSFIDRCDPCVNQMKRARAYCISDFGKCKSGFLTRVRIVNEEDGRGEGGQYNWLVGGGEWVS